MAMTVLVRAQKSRGVFGEFVIDAADEALVHEHQHWYMTDAGYPYTVVPTYRKFIWLTRLLMGKQEGKVIDHIDRQPWNNSRSNLRHVTYSGNSANVAVRRHSKSGVRGVRFHPQSGLWSARICFHKRTISLGYYHEKHEAAAVFIVAHAYFHTELNPGFRTLLRLLFGSEEMSWSGRGERRTREPNGRYASEALA